MLCALCCITACSLFVHVSVVIVCVCVCLQSFDSLISTVEQTGSTRNEIRRTEGLIDTLQERNTNLNMDRVQADLDAIKAENTQLAKRLGIKK